jgi:predicted glycosyltransferase
VPNGNGQHGGHGPRLLIYSQDGFGLGHLRRTSLIGSEFLRACPDACVLTISDSPLGTFFGVVPNQDYLKLPSLVKSGPGMWDPVSLPMSSAELLALRSDLIRSAAVSFSPDVVLVDHMPQGALGELVPALEALASTPTKFVLGLRDILDAPNVVHRTWRTEGAFDVVRAHYDRVLVYGSREVFDVAEAYRWRPAAASLLEYCGYVCAPPSSTKAKRVRNADLADPKDRLIVAMAGGGADAYPVMDALLDGLDEINDAGSVSVVLVTGPFMPAELRRDLKTRAHGRSVKVRKTVKNAASYIAAADVVVGMAGYNTTAEILRARTPAVLVPRSGPSAEQRMRAQLVAERDWVRVVDPDDLSPSKLAPAVVDALGDRPPEVDLGGPDLGGLDVAVGHLLSLLEAPARASSALLGV